MTWQFHHITTTQLRHNKHVAGDCYLSNRILMGLWVWNLCKGGRPSITWFCWTAFVLWAQFWCLKIGFWNSVYDSILQNIQTFAIVCMGKRLQRLIEWNLLHVYQNVWCSQNVRPWNIDSHFPFFFFFLSSVFKKLHVYHFQVMKTYKTTSLA